MREREREGEKKREREREKEREVGGSEAAQWGGERKEVETGGTAWGKVTVKWKLILRPAPRVIFSNHSATPSCWTGVQYSLHTLTALR